MRKDAHINQYRTSDSHIKHAIDIHLLDFSLFIFFSNILVNKNKILNSCIDKLDYK